MSDIKDLIVGSRFGKLTVCGMSDGRTSKGSVKWVVKCDCSTIKEVQGASLRNGHTTSCGCSRRGQRLKLDGGAAASKILKTYKEGAKNRNLDWALTDEEFFVLTNSSCHYCGDPPSNISKSKSQYLPDFQYSGIDRVDNTRGYTPDNVVPSCRVCNAMKEKLSQKEFLNHIAKITRFQIKRTR